MKNQCFISLSTPPSDFSDLESQISDTSLTINTPRQSPKQQDTYRAEFDKVFKPDLSNDEMEDFSEQEEKHEQQRNKLLQQPILNMEAVNKLDPEMRESIKDLLPEGKSEAIHLLENPPMEALKQENIMQLIDALEEKTETEKIDAEIQYHNRILEILQGFRRRVNLYMNKDSGADIIDALAQDFGEEEVQPSPEQKSKRKPRMEFDLFLSSGSDEDDIFKYQGNVELPMRFALPHLSEFSLTIKQPNIEDIANFHKQEKQRYLNPTRPWTYQCNHSKNAIVGPILKNKPVVVKQDPNESAGFKYLKDPPKKLRLVHILRDALSRLPQGMGTLADIVEMMKTSQYLQVSGQQRAIFFSIVKMLLTDLSQRGMDQFIDSPDPEPTVTRHPVQSCIWLYQSKNAEELMKNMEKEKGRAKMKSSSRKIKISLDESLLKPRKQFQDEKSPSKKMKLF